MDGVVIYFTEAKLLDVLNEFDEVRRRDVGSHEYSVFPYEADTWKDELEGDELDELDELVKALGQVPSCAVHISCRHGNAARDALAAVSSVMARFPKSVLDDDFKSWWTSDQVQTCNASAPSDGVYALRRHR